MNQFTRTSSTGTEANISAPQSWSRERLRKPLRAMPQTRRYQVSCLDQSGQITDFVSVAPALPMFEQAFSAFARGSIIATENGPVAVEDLLPGDRILTRDNGAQPLLWVGSIMIVPSVTKQSAGMGKLSRVTADSFGLGRPMPDLLLGPAARLFRQDAVLVSAVGKTGALAPITAFIDNETVLEITPVTPVRVYHLAFARHQIIDVNGLGLESYHPGTRNDTDLLGQMTLLFLALFPQLQSLQQFGPEAYPRTSFKETMDILTA